MKLALPPLSLLCMEWCVIVGVNPSLYRRWFSLFGGNIPQINPCTALLCTYGIDRPKVGLSGSGGGTGAPGPQARLGCCPPHPALAYGLCAGPGVFLRGGLAQLCSFGLGFFLFCYRPRYVLSFLYSFPLFWPMYDVMSAKHLNPPKL
jgi:hypothetical protein